MRKRVKPVKEVKAWGLARESGDLIGTWTKVGDGKEAVTLAAFATKSIAKRFAQKPCNLSVILTPVPVLITPVKPRGKKK